MTTKRSRKAVLGRSTNRFKLTACALVTFLWSERLHKQLKLISESRLYLLRDFMTSDFNSQSINTSEVRLVQLHRKSHGIDAFVM